MHAFKDVLTTEQEIRDIVGVPVARSILKEKRGLDAHVRAFIEKSPFVLIATSGADGTCDVSPKGDTPGFVTVLDERHLVIPDRPGNKRLDGMRNLLDNPHIGLIFLVPGREETVRVNGRAWITKDPELLTRSVVQGKTPQLAIGVEVEQCFLHCVKAFRRSRIWVHEEWLSPDALPSMARVIYDQIQPAGQTANEFECEIEEHNRTRMY